MYLMSHSKTISVLLALVLIANLLWLANFSSAENRKPSAEEVYGPSKNSNPEDLELIKRINLVKEMLRARNSPNNHGASLSTFETPGDVVLIIDELENIFRNAKNKSFSRPEIAKSIVIDAIVLLYKGRGNTTPKDGKGWYLANRSGETGLREIKEILSRDLIDEEIKTALKTFIASYDFTSVQGKRAQGFPPQFEINSDAAKQEVLSAIESAKTTKKPYQPVPKTAQTAMTLMELVEDAIRKEKLPANAKESISQFLESLDNNIYDKSVGTLNSVRSFLNYYGREEIVENILDALTRTEKAHPLLKGKAGVGKTTLLQMAQDGFIQGKYTFKDQLPPVIVELSITAITNPTDPTAIKNSLKALQFLSKGIDREIIAFIDEAHVGTKMFQNAVKGFLSKKFIRDANRVHMVPATTTEESRVFLQDKAFSRRFVDVYVPEFNHDDVIALIKQTQIPVWQEEHQAKGYRFKEFTDDAIELAYKYREVEQPHAGNPTGTKELLEGALVYKLRRGVKAGNTGDFTVTAEDIHKYLKSSTAMELFPGDPEFDVIFENKFKEFSGSMGGTNGLILEWKSRLKSHFATIHRKNMTADINFGPPGGGKSFIAEQIAKYFFNGAILVINGGEYKTGDLGINKLIGSPTGTVGSEEQRSPLTKFISENPQGGVIAIEESDYMHQDILQFFTNMISKREFKDGLGQTWKTDKFIIIQNSNFGQEFMLPTDSKNKMTWEQYNVRRRQLTQKMTIDGVEVEVIRPDKLDQIFDAFVHKIVTKSNPGEDTSAVSQEMLKQKRRYKAHYVLPPTKEELITAARNNVNQFIEDAKLDFGVEFKIADDLISEVINIEKYEFEKGYTYIHNQLEDKLYKYLSSHYGKRGLQFDVKLGVNAEKEKIMIVQELGSKNVTEYAMGRDPELNQNPWASSQEMQKRIHYFVPNMRKRLRGFVAQIEDMKARLIQKTLDWGTNMTTTQLGTTGNGKTEFYKAAAVAIYGTEEALFKISGLTHKYMLTDHLRPPASFKDSNEETPFERWFKSRLHSGGGIILFDELLSLDGLSHEDLSQRLEIINQLYEFLDEQKLKIGKTVYDARSFIPGITGNALQSLFKGLPNSPDAELITNDILKKMTRQRIVEALGKLGLDPPKIARLGKIYLNGPVPKDESIEIGKIKIAQMVEEVKRQIGRSIEIVIDESITNEVVDRLTTVTLGMREVNSGFNTIAQESITGIVKYIPSVKKIEAKLDHEVIHWFADGKEVIFAGVTVDSSGLQDKNWTFKANMDENAKDRTPQLGDIGTAEETKYSPEALKIVTTHEVYGHFMVDAMTGGKNTSDAISLIPDEDYGGYVRHRRPELMSFDTISSMMRRISVLQAGHRAVFLSGIYATGGGNHGGARDPKEPPSDDLGKIREIQNEMINNELIYGINEKSLVRQKENVNKPVYDFMVKVTDKMIQTGRDSKLFDEVYEKTMKDRFIGGADLDKAVEKIMSQTDKFKKPDRFFFQNVSDVLVEYYKHELPKNELEVVVGLYARLYGELTEFALGEESKAEIKSVFTHTMKKIAGEDASKKEELKKIFKKVMSHHGPCADFLK